MIDRDTHTHIYIHTHTHIYIAIFKMSVADIERQLVPSCSSQPGPASWQGTPASGKVTGFELQYDEGFVFGEPLDLK